MEVLEAPNYTILVTANPNAMAIYCHCDSVLPHSKGKKGRTIYNYQEEIAYGISDRNPSTVVAVIEKNWQSVLPVITSLITIHNITNIVTSGWSLGGNDALELSSNIGGKILLMDSNHTNQVHKIVFDAIKGNQCVYISNNYNKTKLAKTEKVRAATEFVYKKIDIPKGYRGSDHRYCRDYAIEHNTYGEMLYDF